MPPVRWKHYIKFSLTMEHYSEVSNSESDGIGLISAAPDGIVWFYMNNGISGFDGKNWTHFPPVNFNGDNSTGAVHFVASKSGIFWLARRNEPIVYRYDGENLNAFPIEARFVYDIAVSPGGTAWFGTDLGVYRFDGKEWTLFDNDYARDCVYDMAVAPDDTLWCGGRYLIHFDHNDWTQYRLPSDMVHSITITPNGDVWSVIRVPGDAIDGGYEMKDMVIRLADGHWISYELSEMGIKYGDKIITASDGSAWIINSYGVVKINN